MTECRDTLVLRSDGAILGKSQWRDRGRLRPASYSIVTRVRRDLVVTSARDIFARYCECRGYTPTVA